MNPFLENPDDSRIRTTIAIWAGIFFIILILVPTVCSIAYYCREDDPWPQNRYLEKFTNYDPTKDVLDIKSIDHENKIIHYYQYRNDPHDWTPEPAPPAASRSSQQTTITIDGVNRNHECTENGKENAQKTVTTVHKNQ